MHQVSPFEELQVGKDSDFPAWGGDEGVEGPGSVPMSSVLAVCAAAFALAAPAGAAAAIAVTPATSRLVTKSCVLAQRFDTATSATRSAGSAYLRPRHAFRNFPGIWAEHATGDRPAVDRIQNFALALFYIKI